MDSVWTWTAKKIQIAFGSIIGEGLDLTSVYKVGPYQL